MNKYKQELIDYNFEHNLYPETIERIMNGLKEIISAKRKEGTITLYNSSLEEVSHCLELMNAIDFLNEYDLKEHTDKVSINVALDIWD